MEAFETSFPQSSFWWYTSYSGSPRYYAWSWHSTQCTPVRICGGSPNCQGQPSSWSFERWGHDLTCASPDISVRTSYCLIYLEVMQIFFVFYTTFWWNRCLSVEKDCATLCWLGWWEKSADACSRLFYLLVSARVHSSNFPGLIPNSKELRNSL